ncbi:MAG: cellulose binding domain-containing protein [Saccharofermentanaceae bacterium]|nr:hypothetical protein [Clostridiaceae bacterium]HOO49640.1 cellulose binding domain-containing protein [Saccharofermentans sp.]HPE27980.1 cellulose binding domain-containing protein [Saccharofermentans sp.]HPJ80713.1 cellulose binding domain-containing protein [Saccharofermentans sp.]HPQ32768.1 cellulose binding domain-containing protein [Saccharofermentans sp.]
MSKCKSWLKIVSMLIVISVVVGAIPLFKVSADSVETSSANLKVTYTQVSSWGSTVQANVDVTNTTNTMVEGWALSLAFDKDVSISSIWNAIQEETLVFQTPPSTVSTIVSTIEMISEVSRIEVPDEDKE